MEDPIRFIWRGALGGALVPLVSFGPFIIIGWYIVYLWMWFIIFILSAAIYGAVVGAILWALCARLFDRLGAISRIMIGAGIGLTVTGLNWISSTLSSTLSSTDSIANDSRGFQRFVFWGLYGVLTTALAAWLCPSAAKPPSATVFRKEPELTYLERVHEYEKAQAEHDYWKARLDAEKSREGKH